MMRRIELVPESYLERRKQRRHMATVVVAGLVALGLLIGWWFLLGTQIAAAEDELAEAQARNAELQAEISDLQRFAELETSLQERRSALATVMAGDVDWPALLTEVAMVVPEEVWLDSLTASAGETEGASQVGTETAPIRISDEKPLGRIRFTGSALSMPGVAKWMIRLESVKDFNAVWLNSATAGESAGSGGNVVAIDTTLEFNERAASNRFEEGETP